jgi:hydroxymethylglutaryl-CoA reductase
VTAVGAPVPYEAQAQQLTAVDAAAGLFYFIGLNVSSQRTSLVALSLDDGSVRAEVALPFVSGFFVGVGEALDFDAETGQLIAMGREVSASGAHHIVSIDPKNGKVRDLTRVRQRRSAAPRISLTRALPQRCADRRR